MPETATRPTPSAGRTRREAESPDPAFWGEPARPRPGLRLPSRPFDAEGLGGRALDRLRAWRGDSRAGVAVLVVVAVVIGFAWYRISLGDTASSAPEPASDATEASGAPPTSSPGGAVVVHVAGAVTTPGVMELPEGSRVIDAVEAAGGGLPDADLDRMNLAAQVTDGQRILVQRVGDPPLAPEAGGTAAPTDPDDAATPGLINVNTATTTELESLPGIGPVLAEAIIDERERRGGFRSVNELRDVRGIGEQRFADIKDLVTV